LAEWRNDRESVLVHTSGSTGEPKAMWVEKKRMEASARITCKFLGLKEGDTALLCMPLDYIAGKMMVVRALTCGLQLLSVEPSGHPLSSPSSPYRGGREGSWGGREGSQGSFAFAAMVPLQVWNSLQVPEERERLMQIRHLIIGGGAIDEELARELKDFPNAVWSTYGMTETLSHIALRRLSGPEASEWYTPFEGVTLSQTPDGCLIIDAPAVHDGPLVTNDVVAFSSPRPLPASPVRGGGGGGGGEGSFSFRVLGRKDNVICSGGVKIQAEEVERRLQPLLKAPFLITKCKDKKFGEQVVLLTEGMDTKAVVAVCREVLPKYWQPRHYLHVDRLPLTATGKPARKEAERLAALAVEV